MLIFFIFLFFMLMLSCGRAGKIFSSVLRSFSDKSFGVGNLMVKWMNK